MKIIFNQGVVILNDSNLSLLFLLFLLQESVIVRRDSDLHQCCNPDKFVELWSPNQTPDSEIKNHLMVDYLICGFNKEKLYLTLLITYPLVDTISCSDYGIISISKIRLMFHLCFCPTLFKMSDSFFC